MDSERSYVAVILKKKSAFRNFLVVSLVHKMRWIEFYFSSLQLQWIFKINL